MQEFYFTIENRKFYLACKQCFGFNCNKNKSGVIEMLKDNNHSIHSCTKSLWVSQAIYDMYVSFSFTNKHATWLNLKVMIFPKEMNIFDHGHMLAAL